jgi:hypothetical protein
LHAIVDHFHFAITHRPSQSKPKKKGKREKKIKTWRKKKQKYISIS